MKRPTVQRNLCRGCDRMLPRAQLVGGRCGTCRIRRLRLKGRV